MVHRHRTREMSSLLRDGAVYYKQIRKSERKPTRLQNSSRTTGHWRTRGKGNFSPMRRHERPSGEREAVEATKPSQDADKKPTSCEPRPGLPNFQASDAVAWRRVAACVATCASPLIPIEKIQNAQRRPPREVVQVRLRNTILLRRPPLPPPGPVAASPRL